MRLPQLARQHDVLLLNWSDAGEFPRRDRAATTATYTAHFTSTPGDRGVHFDERAQRLDRPATNNTGTITAPHAPFRPRRQRHELQR